MQQQTSAAQQIQQLNQALTKALLERDDAQKKVDAANEQINAIRNVMTGVGVGQRLQQEIAAEEKAVAEKAKAPPAPDK